jgi:ABC-2 type transport system permease protein
MSSGSASMRLRGFLRKEFLQIRRDPSSIALALILPVVLLILFGYGVSLDAVNVPVAVVIDDTGPEAREVAARFALSRYFRTTRVHTLAEAERLMRSHEVDAIVHLQGDFARRLAGSDEDGGAPVQVILNAVDANRARLIQGYVQGVLGSWAASRQARGQETLPPTVAVETRMWFNEAVNSTHYLVPGLLTLVMTLTGVLLTALVISREWERGTMEALLATPLRTREFLLGKMLPYYALGMGGMALSVILGVTLFGVPFRGSLGALLLLSTLFLLASLGLGLFISAIFRVQFIAAQVSLVAGFLPAFFLSGLLFDLDSTPTVVRVLSFAIPARYFVTVSQTLFLAGDVWPVLWPNGLALAAMAALFLALARSRLGTRLE